MRVITRPISVLPFLLLGPVALSTAGCAGENVSQGPFSSVTAVESPADAGSGEPNFFSDGDGVLLSWIEPNEDDAHALRFSVHREGAWSEPLTIAQGDNWFVNWADFPSVVAFDEGRSLAAHWLEKVGEGPYAYGIKMSLSRDGGKTWGPPVTPHRDGTETEHGFVSMLPWADGRLLVVWLDGRNFAATPSAPAGEEGHEGHGSTAAMTLRSAVMDAEGHLHDEALLDERVCDCCQTAALRTPGGAVVAYRDRSDDEIRDISFVRVENGGWTAPSPVFSDEWQVPGCPVNGPALSGDGSRAAAAWYTGAGEASRVKVAFSSDEGRMFGLPVRVDDGDPIGRVDVLMLPSGDALVSWIEGRGEEADVRARLVRADGTAGPSVVIATSSRARASGFPRMARRGDEIFFAWTDVGASSIVRTAVATLK